MLRILRDDLPVVRVARQAVDQVQDCSPTTKPPELAEVGSRELGGEVVLELSPVPAD